jgi:hypothetical protein
MKRINEQHTPLSRLDFPIIRLEREEVVLSRWAEEG